MLCVYKAQYPHDTDIKLTQKTTLKPRFITWLSNSKLTHVLATFTTRHLGTTLRGTQVNFTELQWSPAVCFFRLCFKVTYVIEYIYLPKKHGNMPSQTKKTCSALSLTLPLYQIQLNPLGDFFPSDSHWAQSKCRPSPNSSKTWSLKWQAENCIGSTPKKPQDADSSSLPGLLHL